MNDLSKVNVLIAVFAMPDCHACESFTPKIAAAAHAAGRPFQVHDERTPIRKGAVPVVFYDVSQPDPEISAFADRYKVEATPTTLVLTRSGGVFKVEGALTDEQIAHLLQIAREANR